MEIKIINMLLVRAKVFVFLLILWTVFIAGIVLQGDAFSLHENRNLASKPLVPDTWGGVQSYPKKLTTYYGDHFGFRNQMIKIYFLLSRKIYATSIDSDVTIGKDGWLFLGKDELGYRGYEDPFGDARNINIYTDLSLAQFKKDLLEINNYLHDEEVGFLFFIAPNKHTIYKEKLPKHLPKENPKSAFDQVLEVLREEEIFTVDLRPPLTHAKPEQQVYYQYDTHWNSLGANVAQYEITKSIKSELNFDINPFILDVADFNSVPMVDADLAKFIHLDNYKEYNYQPDFKSKCTPVLISNGKKYDSYLCEAQHHTALIFGDSFMNALRPFISRNFKKSYYVQHALSKSLIKKYVSELQPDIVIIEIIERKLPFIIPSD